MNVRGVGRGAGGSGTGRGWGRGGEAEGGPGRGAGGSDGSALAGPAGPFGVPARGPRGWGARDAARRGQP